MKDAYSESSGIYDLARLGGLSTPAPATTMVSPPIDVYEDERAWLIFADIPGVAEQDARLDLVDDELVLDASRSAFAPPSSRARAEAGIRYLRRIPIPGLVDLNEVDAMLVNGTLRIRLPKGARTRQPLLDVMVESSATFAPRCEESDLEQIDDADIVELTDDDFAPC